MPYIRVVGAAEREKRRKREEERRELETWTQNRPGGFTGRLRSDDDEVRSRWASFFKIKPKYCKPRTLSHHRGTTPDETEDDNGDPDEVPTDQPGPSESTPFPTMTPSEYVRTFHLNGMPNFACDFWSSQPGGTQELWEAVSITMEDETFQEV